MAVDIHCHVLWFQDVSGRSNTLFAAVFPASNPNEQRQKGRNLSCRWVKTNIFPQHVVKGTCQVVIWLYGGLHDDYKEHYSNGDLNGFDRIDRIWWSSCGCSIRSPFFHYRIDLMSTQCLLSEQLVCWSALQQFPHCRDPNEPSCNQNGTCKEHPIGSFQSWISDLVR